MPGVANGADVGRGDRPQLACLVVAHRLDDLLARVHDEGAVEDRRLTDRLTTEEDDLKRRGSRVLRLVRSDLDRIASAKDGEP